MKRKIWIACVIENVRDAIRRFRAMQGLLGPLWCDFPRKRNRPMLFPIRVRDVRGHQRFHAHTDKQIELLRRERQLNGDAG